ncbi:MAG: peptidase S41 [Alphaproteobacteria bacterium]|nr:peptidase S41 [Alphaproteobacteria bacterium]
MSPFPKKTFLTLLTGAAIILGSSGHTVHAQEERINGTNPDTLGRDSAETYRQLDLFGEVFERTRAQYVDEVEDKTLIKHALNGMLSSLDPHSSYLDEDDFTDMRVQTSGEFGGLGIEVTMENGLVKVVSPIDDTPAYKAGIQAGDMITMLDDQPVMGLTLGEAVDLMRGKVGTDIKLTVVREGVPDPLEISIERDVIRIQSVRHRIEQEDVGYIRVTTFNQNTTDGVIDAIKQIKEDVDGDVSGYILDLRNNPGGLLDQAIGVADVFLDKGEIVSTRGRNKNDSKRDNASAGDLADGQPIVVLINAGSASASEIVAGALQDQHRAIVLGTQSFGKGSVQTVIPLPGNGAMRMTTARYYTPSGRSIQASGITPDIIVEQARIEELAEIRLREKDLKGSLANPNVLSENENKPVDEEVEAAIEEKDEIDYQLARAIDLIRGLDLFQTNTKASNDNSLREPTPEEKEAAEKEMQRLKPAEDEN